MRQVGYTVNGTDNDLRTLEVDTTMLFINPKIGLDYIVTQAASSSPRLRVEAENLCAMISSTGPPRLTRKPSSDRPRIGLEISAGMEHAGGRLFHAIRKSVGADGGIERCGFADRQNVSSYRAGVEWTNVCPMNGLQWYSTVTASQNRITDFGLTRACSRQTSAFRPISPHRAL